MGRNWVPKFGEWRDGELHDIRATGGDYPKSDDGKQVIYSVTRRTSGGDAKETLAVAWADGLQGLLASFFQDGYARGKRDGVLEAKRDMRRTLGIPE